MLVDEVTISVKAGDGGRGCVSFRREKYVPRGGPDGGDGGDGGSVILESDPDIHTLLDLTYHRRNLAKRGEHGQGKKMHGRRGKDLVLRVPAGTEVRDAETGELLADLVKKGQRFTAARGGKGGRGNARFATPTDRAPRFAEPGLPGEERRLLLQLKILADVGMVGFPNAGKSTLISTITEAHPKTAPYPFTTLEPYLGVLHGPGWEVLVLADLPGLIEGAHRGLGLGTRFLRHVQRTRALLHVVDLDPSTGRDPVEDWKKIQAELAAFEPALARRPQVVAANKIDLPGAAERLKPLRGFLGRRRIKAVPISALKGEGLEELVKVVFEVLEKAGGKAARGKA